MPAPSHHNNNNNNNHNGALQALQQRRPPLLRLNLLKKGHHQNLHNHNPLPKPFKPVPPTLLPFCAPLSPSHIYVSHIDSKPRAFKAKIFSVPVLMNLAVAALFLWRIYYIGPYYSLLLVSALGTENELTLRAADLTRTELARVVLRRTATFCLDFVLAVFVWPWPVEFLLGTPPHGSPCRWRWSVGFRDREIYVRRSRAKWDKELGDVIESSEARNVLWAMVGPATSAQLLQQKTGYLTMNGEWDLDWAAMVAAHKMVDGKEVPMDTFGTLVLLHHEKHGWLYLEMNIGDNAKEEERRRQVFAFRDALAKIGKENMFYRWIEIVQELFREEGIDFDLFWRESVGKDTLEGI
ncbi:hypothetical protein B0T17DRAFT_617455 [Bombardia bombarda]|uniref:Uncharacterized protein n=1 Tax=Bombardia bombarda TaxID=252184 RepID=A0AA40C5G2_9PEZI|nr:hypothetical protein B0T17DRAFT_617455 [Bombardia bombarda]